MGAAVSSARGFVTETGGLEVALQQTQSGSSRKGQASQHERHELWSLAEPGAPGAAQVQLSQRSEPHTPRQDDGGHGGVWFRGLL